MTIRRWINALLPTYFGCCVREQKPMPHRNRCRPVLEMLEDRIVPAAAFAEFVDPDPRPAMTLAPTCCR